jgi:hypothetical protein
MPGDGCLNGFALIADVTYTRPFQTIGDDQPCPGIGVTHATFSVFDQVNGSCASPAWPSAVGPRKPGQEAGGAEDAAAPSAITTEHIKDKNFIRRPQ